MSRWMLTINHGLLNQESTVLTFFFLSKIAEFVKEADGMPIQHNLFLMCRTKPENMSVDIPDLSIELTTLLIFSDITPLFLFGLKD